jgi:hypothetical protein
VFQDFDSDGTLGLGPPAGTLTIDGSAILNAGTTYSLGFQFTTDNFAIPPAQAAWLGDGEIYMSIRPIPEPAALLPLAFAALFLRRHKSHRLP